MSDQIKNINPWAEKLQEIGLPDINESWQRMHADLDVHMPVKKRRKRRFIFWVLMVPAIALVLFFLNPDGFRSSSKKNTLAVDKTLSNRKKTDSAKNSPRQMTERDEKGEMDNHGVAQNKVVLKNDASSQARNFKNAPEKIHENSKVRHGGQENDFKGIKESASTKLAYTIGKRDKKQNSRNNLTEHQRKSLTENRNMTRVPEASDILSVVPQKRAGKPAYSKKKSSNTPGMSNNADIGIDRNIKNGQNQQTNLTDQDKMNGNDSAKNLERMETPFPEVQTSGWLGVLDDGKFRLKAAPTKKPDKKSQEQMPLRFAAGIGLNQFLPFAGQYYSALDASGNSNRLTDYIPAATFRVYLSRKIFIQLEAEINAPQYTKNIVITNKPVADTVSSTTIVYRQDSSTIKKLFYFDFPISFHYNIFKNFYAGAGFQLSSLTNGVGSFGTKVDSSVNGHSTFIYTSFADGNLKSAPVYKQIKTAEWRLLLDLNYQWKKLVLGTRYTQAFNNIVNQQFLTGPAAGNKNRSFQLYIRYFLWQNKKAK